MSASFKVIKHTMVPCDICKTWRLTKVELYNGDRALKCFHCNEMKWEMMYDIHRRYVTAKPLEKVTFNSHEDVLERCVQVMAELD